MPRFDRYMLSQLIVLFGFFALILILVYWINRAVILFDQLIADGQSAWVFLEFTVLSLPAIVKIVLPIAAAVAAIYVTNRMSSESELTVVQATGYSGFRLARPVFVFGLIVTLLMSALVHYLVPAAQKSYADRTREVQQNVVARLLTEGVFLNPIDGVTFYIRDITPAGELLDIFLSDTRSAAESVSYTAERAFIVGTDSGPQLVMIAGMAQTLQYDGNRLITTGFDDFAFDISSFVSTDTQNKRSLNQIATWELMSPTETVLDETGVSVDRLFAEVHLRSAEATLSIIAAILGFSTLLIGGFNRFGVWRQIVLAIFLIIGVKMVDTAVINVVRNTPQNWPLAYLATIVGFTIVWFQLFWSTRPYLFRRRPSVNDAEGSI